MILLLSLALASCNKPSSATTTTDASAPSSAPSATLTAVIDASVTDEAKPIHIVRETAKPGDAVTISGRIMGALNPFVEGRAAFILGDTEVLTACNDRPGDECETPWDTCCDSKEDRKRGTASIQILDADGRTLKEPVEGVSGIEKLARLTVSGTVAEGSNTDLLIINATAIDALP